MARLFGTVRVEGNLATLEERAAPKRMAAEAYYNQVRQTPITWDFGEIPALDDAGVSAGPAGVQTLQMRENAPPKSDDVKNWQSVAISAGIARQAGIGDVALISLKTTANVWVQTTANQALTVLVDGDGVQTSAFRRGLAMLENFGAIKKAIKDALDAIDVTAGYPA